ncbi:hypothetical protein SAMN04487905_11323 [Actinopolyspora xinjiangensis]|uniref:Uncharacterized protein n=1 Tax=Actinopolyspora xinjiangensis TaxID=405564 RepID=A0A1H0WM47_9ACTN|nr:hypothetical protein SAMN04487905_11323 [Actinopolyspora xinjiangensis]
MCGKRAPTTGPLANRTTFPSHGSRSVSRLSILGESANTSPPVNQRPTRAAGEVHTGIPFIIKNFLTWYFDHKSHH